MNYQASYEEIDRMQTLDLNDDVGENPDTKKRFWRRQFQEQTTTAQRKFDWIAGVILPVICIAYDPGVFRNSVLGGQSWLGDFKAFAYLLSFVSIMGMMAWLIWGARLKWINSLLAGLFILGGAVSLVIGVMLAPVSLLGLIVLIGALGFTPLLSSIVYLRNGVRAFRAARPFLDKRTLVHSMALSAVLSAAIPFTIQAEIHKSLSAIKSGDIETVKWESRKLRVLSPLVNFDSLREHYRLSKDIQHTPQLRIVADFYEEMTGESIETHFFD
jgi:hypothetical protein